MGEGEADWPGLAENVASVRAGPRWVLQRPLPFLMVFSVQGEALRVRRYYI